MLSSIDELFKCDRTLDRINIAHQIIEALDTSEDDFGTTERLVRHHFINIIKAYAVSQNKKQKQMIAGFSHFYQKNYPAVAKRPDAA
jgi:hypothetical protein